MTASVPRGRAPLVTWLGALAFVGSLAYFLYFYFVRLGRPAPPAVSLGVPLAVNAALFGVFALHHSVMARTGAKRWIGRHLPPSLERTAYVWVSSALFVAVCLLWQDLPGRIYRAPWPLAALFYAVQLGGIWLTARSTGIIDPMELAGVRQAAGGTAPPRFRVVGPYRWVRHPIYFAWLLVVFGTPDLTVNRLAFAVVSSLYLAMAIPFEERSLVEAFGDEYRRYQRAVRWRLVPGVW